MSDAVAINDINGIRLVPRGGGLCPRSNCGLPVRRLRETKRCPECGTTRLADVFSHNPSRSDHLDSRCRLCVNSHKRSGAIEMMMPNNPVDTGAIFGSLHDHIAGMSDGRRGGFSTMRLTDATVIDYWTSKRTFLDEVYVNHRNGFKFPYRIGDRVALAFSNGVLGKVLHVSSGKVVFEDGFPDSRLSLVELFKRWYPNWSPPPALHPWPEEEVRVQCPLALHTDRTARINPYGEFACSRHTGAEDTGPGGPSLPVYWTAVDVLQRRFGLKDEAAAVAELSRIEDENLAVLAAEVWGA